MCWRDSFCVAGIGAHGRQRTTIQNTFDLNDDGVKRVHVENITARGAGKMSFKEPNNSFPQTAIRRRSGGNETPLQTFFQELVI